MANKLLVSTRSKCQSKATRKLLTRCLVVLIEQSAGDDWSGNVFRSVDDLLGTDLEPFKRPSMNVKPCHVQLLWHHKDRFLQRSLILGTPKVTFMLAFDVIKQQSFGVTGDVLSFQRHRQSERSWGSSVWLVRQWTAPSEKLTQPTSLAFSQFET